MTITRLLLALPLSLFALTVASAQDDDPPPTAFAKAMLDATKLISKDHIKPVSQADQIRWIVAGMFKAAGRPIPQTLSKRIAKIENANEKEMFGVLHDTRAMLDNHPAFKNPADLDIAIQSIFDKLEPGFKHPSQDSIEPLNLTGSSPVGIGLTVQPDLATGMLKVVTTALGSPAYKAGIRAGDLISKIEYPNMDKHGNMQPGKKVKKVATKGMTPATAEGILLGPWGTKVKLTLTDVSGKKKRQVEVMRAAGYQRETVLGNTRETCDAWNFYLDPDARFVYLRLTQFSTDTFRDTETAVKKLSKAGICGFILDLRFNPGGLLDSAVKSADLFIDDGIIVTIKKRAGSWISYAGKHEGSYLSFPMVCLVNGQSASGSEIVAACLQDHDRAIIVGARTKGKAEVRTLNPLGDGLLSLMTASFYRPSGKNLSKFLADGHDTWGVQPNPGFAVPLSAMEELQLQQYLDDKLILRHKEDQAKAPVFKDRQLEAAVAYLGNLPKTKTTAPKK